MFEINFSVNVDCRPAPRHRTTGNTHYNPTWYTNLKSIIANKAIQTMGTMRPIEDPITIKLIIYREFEPYHKQFGDIDNLLKTVLDSLNGICYQDDKQIISAIISLFKGTPKIDVQIKTCAA